MHNATARTELEELLGLAKDLVPGEWTVRGDALLPCTTADGRSGDATSLSFNGPAPADPAAAIDSVVAAWTERGFGVDAGTLPDGALRVQFRDTATNLYLQFEARPDRTSVVGESRCVPAVE